MLKPCVAVALALSVFLMPCLIHAMDDDYVPDDAYVAPDDAETIPDDEGVAPVPAPAQKAADKSATEPGIEETLKIALFNVRQTVEAEKRTSRDMVPLINKQLKEALSAINVKPTQIVEHESLMSGLNRRQLYMYERCWIDQSCLSGLIDGGNYDLMVVGKLSAKLVELDASLGASFVELSLLVRLVEMKNMRILKEFLIVESDETRLLEKSYQRLYSELKRLGYIIDKNKPVEDSNTGRTDDIVFITPPVVEERTNAMQIAKWTTFGTGLFCAGLGGVFTGLAAKASEDQKNASSLYGLESNRYKRDNYILASYILYGVGGGLFISSVVLFVLDSQNAGSGGSDIWDGASVTPTEGGAFVSTGFSF